MSRYDDTEQSRPLDETTSAKVQHFDADGYVLPDEDAAREAEEARAAAASDGTEAQAGVESDVPSADDGLFNTQQMPTADGELSHPDPGAGFADDQTERTSTMSNPDGILSEPDRTIDVDGTSILPGPDETGSGDPGRHEPGPDEPVPAAPEGVPVDPDLTPDEPAPFAPDEGVGSGDAREVPGPAL